MVLGSRRNSFTRFRAVRGSARSLASAFMPEAALSRTQALVPHSLASNMIALEYAVLNNAVLNNVSATVCIAAEYPGAVAAMGSRHSSRGTERITCPSSLKT